MKKRLLKALGEAALLTVAVTTAESVIDAKPKTPTELGHAARSGAYAGIALLIRNQLLAGVLGGSKEQQ